MSKDYIFEPRPIYSSYTPNLFLGSYYIEDGFRADPTMWADPLEDAFVTNAGMKEGKIDTGTYLDNFSAETFLMGTKKLDALEVLPQSYFWKWDNYDAHLQIPTEISEDNFEFSAYERYLECAAGYVSDNDPYFLLVIDAFMDEGQDIDLWAEEADWTRIQTTVRWWKLYDLWMEDEGVDFLTNLAHEDYDWSIRNAGELQNIGYEIPEPDDDDYYWSMRQAESFAANDPPSYRGLLLKPANHVGRSKICDAKGCRKVMKHWRRSWGIPYYFCDQHQQHIDDTYQAENEGSWMTFGRVDYNWATEPDDVELTDEEFQEIDELVRDEIRYEIDRDNIPGDSSMYWYGDWEAHGHEEFTISYYWGPAQTTGVNSAEGFGAESDQFPSMHYGDYDSDAQEKYQDFIYEWDLDDNPPSFEEWYRGNKYHEAEVCPCGCAMVGCVCSPSCKGECLGAESFSAEMGDLVKDNEWIVFGTKKTGGTTQGNQGMMLGRSPSLKGAKKMMENFRKKGYGNRYATIGKRLKRQKALLGGLLEAEGDVCWRCAEYGDKIPSHCKNCGVCEECECAVECESRETLGSETLVWKDKTLSFMDWAKQEEASHLKKYRAESFSAENLPKGHPKTKTFEYKMDNMDRPYLDMSNADLYNANLSGADLSYADLSDAKMINAHMVEANLSDANLTFANLHYASLGEVNLTKAFLRSADLSNAILDGADLSNADLSRVNLSGADLSSADLNGANLRYADLSGMVVHKGEIPKLKILRNPPGWNKKPKKVGECMGCDSEDIEFYHDYYGGFCGGDCFDGYLEENKLENYSITQNAESFEAPYTGAGSLMGITGDTDLSSFTSKELTESSAIHGDFDTASLDYSGHQNIEVRAEDNSLQRVWTILIDDNDAYSETFVFNSKKSAINFREAAMDSEYLAQQDIGVYNIVEQQVIDEEYPSDSYIADFLSIDCLKCGDDCGCDEIGLDAEARLSPQEALEVCEAGGAVYLKDYTDQPDDYDSFDYPIEDPEDIRMYIEEGLFDGPNAVTILSEPRPMEASVRF